MWSQYGERDIGLNDMKHNYHSIYFRLARLLLLAACLSGLCFILLNQVGEYCIDTYLNDPVRISKQDEKYVSRLQQYVTQNQLSFDDSQALEAWVKKQGVIAIQVFQDQILIYDSMYPEDISWTELESVELYDWASYYTITFADGPAEVHIFGLYGYQSYTYLLIGELIVSFLLFLLIVMLGIRKTMAYIRQLSTEIAILESGNLEYQITVSGKDELSMLAKGLDDMRSSFRQQVDAKTALTNAHQRMITEISHDLRTPLTSIMLYTEILQQQPENVTQQRVCIEKIDRQARRLKQLVNNLFDYALITEDMEIPQEPPLLFQEAFYDPLSEAAAYLEQNGYQTAMDLSWEPVQIRVCTNYIGRVLDNLTSNIIKYADPAVPVHIRTVTENGLIGLSFFNARLHAPERKESTQIGLRNISGMMEKMGGCCQVTETAHSFTLSLLFQPVSAEAGTQSTIQETR